MSCATYMVARLTVASLILVIVLGFDEGPASRHEALAAARKAQSEVDTLGRELQHAKRRSRLAYGAHISRATSHRNALLRRVPHFWYETILGLPHYGAFLSLLPADTGRFEDQPPGTGDSYVHPDARSVADEPQRDVRDHAVLREFLSEVRCYVVCGGDALERAHLDRLVYGPNPVTPGTDGTVQPDLGSYYVPDDLGTGTSFDSLDPATESYRVVLTFKSNPYFADLRLYKQMPIAHAHMLFTSDDDLRSSIGLAPRLGQGNSVSWTSRRVRDALLSNAADGSPSFFALFDDEWYRDADRELKRVLQHRAAALISSACMYLESDPLPFYERRRMEEQSHVERVRLLFGNSGRQGFTDPVIVPEDPFGEEEVPPAPSDAWSPALDTQHSPHPPQESTAKPLPRVSEPQQNETH